MLVGVRTGERLGTADVGRTEHMVVGKQMGVPKPFRRLGEVAHDEGIGPDLVLRENYADCERRSQRDVGGSAGVNRYRRSAFPRRILNLVSSSNPSSCLWAD